MMVSYVMSAEGPSKVVLSSKEPNISEFSYCFNLTQKQSRWVQARYSRVYLLDPNLQFKKQERGSVNPLYIEL